jgi:hypothetical protein
MKRFFFSLALLFGFGALSHGQYPMSPEPSKPGALTRMFSSGSKTQYTAEEQQLQAYWAAYYRGLANYYASLNNVDWVAYYKANGYPIDPRFYNPYGIAPGTVMVPMQPIAMQNQAQPVMVPPSKMGNGIVQAGYRDPMLMGVGKTENPEKKAPTVPTKSSSRR